MKTMVTTARFAVRMLFGSRGARRDRRRSLQQAAHPEAGLRALFADAPGPPGDAFDDEPVFILSAGWRSGSTLLQRLIASGQDVLIWGEPYDRSTLIQRLAASAAPFSADWPPEGYLKPSADLDRLSNLWTANLYPPPEAVRAAHRAFMLELFARPARALGAARWGVKEVRFGLAEAVYLQALFPHGRFLFIRRGLHEAYRSYRGFSGAMDWYAAWPRATAFTPYGFARHWARMTAELEQAAQATGGLLIDYEDLVAGRTDLDAIGRYCALTVDPATLENRVGSGVKDGRAPRPLSRLERAFLALGQRRGRPAGRP